MQPKTHAYAAETIGNIMSLNIPAFTADTPLQDMLHHITKDSWDSIRTAYVVDAERRLLGIIDLASLIHHDRATKASELMRLPADVLHPNDDQEKAVFIAVKDNDAVLPVVNSEGILLGAVTARNIIGIMHAEHIEDALLASGIRKGRKGMQIARLASERTGLIVRMRTPWLIVGLAAGLGLGLVSSFFEESLQHTVALAYFIPVVAYIADSVGTQSEAITVRALATMKIRYHAYLLKELLVGMTLGALVGILGGIGAGLIGQSVALGIVVGLSLFTASTVAAVLAATIPMLFKARGKDPALGSGPLATAIQDLISVIIYFAFAVMLIG
ncbi:MAG TPA: magnesium transporter [Candidatus Saccharimonadales bacterium]|nr:magnesium transporter [Candidatus Saccharimonadales bacterium]